MGERWCRCCELAADAEDCPECGQETTERPDWLLSDDGTYEKENPR